MGWFRKREAVKDLERNPREQIDQAAYLWKVIHQLEQSTREIRMATKETLDALAAATAQLDTSRAASVAATEKLLAAAAAVPPAPVADDAEIMGAVAEIKSQTDALDAETAKAEASLAPTA